VREWYSCMGGYGVAMDTPPPVIGFAELIDVLGVSRTRVIQLMRRPDFPTPLAVLRMGQVWTYADVMEFCERTGRTVHPITGVGG